MESVPAELRAEELPRPAGVRELFSAGVYRWMFLSNIAFFLAMQSQSVARGYLAYQLTGSAFALGSVSFAVAVPLFVISPLGGVLADRVERRRLIMLAQSIVVLSELTVLTLYVLGRLRFWHLIASALAMGCVFPLMMPARQAIVANIVGRDLLPRAIAINMMGMNGMRVIGPALGGLLIIGDDIRFAYAMGLVFYCTALLCMVGVGAAPAPEDARTQSVWANLTEGFRYIAGDRLVALLLIFGLVPMFLGMPFQQLLPVFTEKVWPVGAQGLGTLAAVTGLGGVAGSFLVAWHGDLDRRLVLQMCAMLGFGSGLALFCWTPWFSLALPLAGFATLCASVFGTVNSTAIQLVIPDAVRGRVSSFLMMSFSLPLLGVLPVSYFAQEFGVQRAVSAAAGLAILIALGFFIGSPTLRRVDAAVRRASERPVETGKA